jgi:hypothetical protein
MALFAVLALIFSSVSADEGMWTFDRFPSAQVGHAYGFTPDSAWLAHVRLSTLRMTSGCSASLVSAQGLVMTNHHCALDCIQSASGTTRKDYNRDGFLARTTAEEARCPGMELDQLTDIEDVTERVRHATGDAGPATFAQVQQSELAAIEKECARSADARCDVVSLYHGGRYDLYKYRRYRDVRLVFAPEDRIASFGGDPDNFNFPRYDLDLTLLRAYGSDGEQLRNAEHLAWSTGALREGDLTFVPGSPYGTSRGLTVAELDDERDVKLPREMLRLAELCGFVVQYQERSAARKRQVAGFVSDWRNGLKLYVGLHQALADNDFHDRLVANERDFRARVMGDPELAQRYGNVWNAISRLVREGDEHRKEYDALEGGPRESSLFMIARRLVRHADEMSKPDIERLPEYRDTRLPELKATVLADTPIHDDLEISLLTLALNRMRADLGPDHPAVRSILGMRSPGQIATDAVRHSRLKAQKVDSRGDVIAGYRKALWDGGKAAVDLSHDPLIKLARAFEPWARNIRRKMETEVEGPLRQQQELLAQARFAIYGETTYPDATFAPRLSYGAVKGWVETGHPVSPFTLFEGAFSRATGAEPFQLPDSWTKNKSRLNLDTPMNLVTNNDVVGGNSGSPLIDRKGEVVGLVFDGNIHALGGEYGFDPTLNRTVAVDSRAILEALHKIYGATHIVKELTQTSSAWNYAY